MTRSQASDLRFELHSSWIWADKCYDHGCVDGFIYRCSNEVERGAAIQLCRPPRWANYFTILQFHSGQRQGFNCVLRINNEEQ